MPVPWIQIVRLMPSILEVSRELLKRTRRSTSTELSADGRGPEALEARVTALEDTERRAAELDSKMAEQLAEITGAVTALHTQMRRLAAFQIATALVAVVALVLSVIR
jgi:hypothetical protein